MTREEAIDLLDNLIGMVDDNHNSDYDTALQMAIQALEQTKWIPVSERLPEYSGNYLITIADSNYKNGQHFEISWFYPSDHVWSFRNADVIAWMPIPQPYKAESEDEE